MDETSPNSGKAETRRQDAAHEHGPFSRLASALFRPAEAPTSPPLSPHLAGAESLGAARTDRYREVADQLSGDVTAFDSADVAQARSIGRMLGAALLARIEAEATRNILLLSRWILLAAAVAFLLGYVYERASHGAMRRDVFFFGAADFGLGFLLSIGLAYFVTLSARRAVSAFRQAESALVALVQKATHDFHDRLIALRAQMETPGGATPLQTVTAASEARLLTVSALRFFKLAPLIGADGEGYRCHVVAGTLQDAANAAFRRGSGVAFHLAVLAAGAAIGAFVLFVSLTPPLALSPPPALLLAVLAFERAHPGALLFPLVVFAALGVPFLLGPAGAQLAAAASPAGVLSQDPARALANDLQVKALGAAAERERDFIERYADALINLEARAGAWSPRAGHAASATERTAQDLETPAWRRPPDGPRFVATGFQATPRAFLAGSDGNRPSRDAASRPEPAPKRGFFDRSRPSDV